MQGTWVWFLIQEDSTCGGGNQACELWLASLRALDPVLFNKRSRHNEKLEKACVQQQRPSAAKK